MTSALQISVAALLLVSVALILFGVRCFARTAPLPPPGSIPRGEDGEAGSLAAVLAELGFEAQDLFASAGVALAVTRPDGFVFYSSPRMVEIFGQSLDPSVGIDGWEDKYQVFRPDRQTPVPLAEYPAILAAKHRRRFAQAQSNLRPDGRWADVYLTASPLIKSGKVVAVVNTAIPLIDAMTDSNIALLHNLERMMGE